MCENNLRCSWRRRRRRRLEEDDPNWRNSRTDIRHGRNDPRCSWRRLEEDLKKKIWADENRGQIFVTAGTRKENHKFSEELFQDSAHYSHNKCLWLQMETCCYAVSSCHASAIIPLDPFSKSSGHTSVPSSLTLWWCDDTHESSSRVGMVM